VAQKAVGVDTLARPHPEMLLQGREGTVVTDRDRPDGPDDSGEVPSQKSWPAAGGHAAEDENAQVGEVRHHHEIGKSRVDGIHDADGTARPLPY
jgi:hypothetical protein